MDDLRMLREMFLHMEWADAQVWQAVLAGPQTASDRTLRERLYHIHVAQRAFLQIWSRIPLQIPELTHFPDLIAVAAWGRACHADLAAYIGGADPAAFDLPVAIPWAGRIEARYGHPPAPATLGQTMLQVVSHSTHHRGQINAQLRALEVEPPLVDFLAWVWLGSPAADWPLPHES